MGYFRRLSRKLYEIHVGSWLLWITNRKS